MRTIHTSRRVRSAAGEYSVTADKSVPDELCRKVISRLEEAGKLPLSEGEGGAAAPPAEGPVEWNVTLDEKDVYVWLFKDRIEIYPVE